MYGFMQVGDEASRTNSAADSRINGAASQGNGNAMKTIWEFFSALSMDANGRDTGCSGVATLNH